MCAYLTVGELAQRGGTTVSALHFYERQGLITPARSAGNQRRYPPCAVHLVGVIVAARAAGESIGAIRRLFQPLPSDRPPTKQEWAQIVTELRSILNAQITRIRQLQHDITQLADHVCLDQQASRTVSAPGNDRRDPLDHRPQSWAEIPAGEEDDRRCGQNSMTERRKLD